MSCELDYDSKLIKEKNVAHTFIPSTGEAEQADLSELEASLVYIGSSRTTRAI